MQRDDLLVWIDLEMTGADDVLKNHILEAAVIITDRDLQVVAEGPDIVINAPDEALAGMDATVREMHEKSGLTAAVRKSTVTLAQAEEQVLSFLEKYTTPQTAPLCGNTIWVDRHFLAIHMPKVEQYLFYRCLDVSSIKIAAQQWRSEVFEAARAGKGESTHRAMDDIKASIEELKFYRNTLFAR